MPWTKIDDHFHAHPKVLAAWRACKASIGLHAMALSHSSAYLNDGEVPEWWVKDQLPKVAERNRAVDALVDAGLWEPRDGGWTIHDYLDFNECRADVLARRGASPSRARAQAGGRASGHARVPTRPTPDLFPQLAG